MFIREGKKTRMKEDGKSVRDPEWLTSSHCHWPAEIIE